MLAAGPGAKLMPTLRLLLRQEGVPGLYKVNADASCCAINQVMSLRNGHAAVQGSVPAILSMAPGGAVFYGVQLDLHAH